MEVAVSALKKESAAFKKSESRYALANTTKRGSADSIAAVSSLDRSFIRQYSAVLSSDRSRPSLLSRRSSQRDDGSINALQNLQLNEYRTRQEHNADGAADRSHSSSAFSSTASNVSDEYSLRSSYRRQMIIVVCSRPQKARYTTWRRSMRAAPLTIG